MNSLLLRLTMTAAMLVPATALAQTAPSMQRLEGIWIFRALFEGAPQPAYVGTAVFGADGKFSGPPNDQTGGPALGEWIRTGEREFAFTYVANSYDKSGAFSGTYQVRGMMKLSDDSLSATGKTKFSILDPAGKAVFASTTTFTATRVVVEPF